MLTGVHPFREARPRDIAAGILNKEPAPLSVHRGTCPPVLQETVSRMLAKRTSERGPGIPAVRGALSTVIKQIEQPAGRPGLSAALRRPTVWVPALLVLLAIAAGSAWAVQRWQHQRWVREVDYQQARQIPSIRAYTVHRIHGSGAGETTPYDYVEVVEVTDIDTYRRDIAGHPAAARIVTEIGRYVESVGSAWGEPLVGGPS